MTTEYCRRVKKRQGLTNRESDVLELILRGQFVSLMAEALCVSENTARSHCRTEPPPISLDRESNVGGMGGIFMSFNLRHRHDKKIGEK